MNGLIGVVLVLLIALLGVLWNVPWIALFWMVFGYLLMFVPLMVLVLYLILAERKIMGYMQYRVGPNRVGPLGSLQTVADGAKFLLKEIIIPERADRDLYLLAPLLSLVPAFAIWSIIPVDVGWVLADVNCGVLAVLAMMSLGSYGILLAGWASNSKYAFISAIRAMAQMVSYEIAMGFALLGVLLVSGSMNLQEIVLKQQGGIGHWYIVVLFPIAAVYWISALAEVNRAPFDVVEGESELVAGYQVEYSGFAFAMFFVAEYTNMILVSALMSLLFLGGWWSPFEGTPLDFVAAWVPGVAWLLLKTSLCLYAMIWIRCTFPRYRYDQLMMLGWKVLIPVAFAWIMLITVLIRLGWIA